MTTTYSIARIDGDGIGPDVTAATLHVVEAALGRIGGRALHLDPIRAGAAYFAETGQDIEPGGEARAGDSDAILLGAIGLPSIRHADGTEISPHLRLRDRYGLYAGVRPVRSYPNGVQRLADPRAAGIDMVILRESTEGLFYSAAVHGRARVTEDAVEDTMRITRATTEKLHDFAFRLAARRRDRGRGGHVTCVDKANVFASQAFFRRIFDEVAARHPDVPHGYNYVDAMALDCIRQPWNFDVMVMENMFGDILSDLTAALVGGMGMASCAEIGDEIGLFQPAHGSAPDIAGQDKANPLAAILSGALMLDDLGQRAGDSAMTEAGDLIDRAVWHGLEQRRLRPMELGGDMGTKAVTDTLVDLVGEVA
jgi:3-isopropylmalate dehydrogenase